MPMAKPTASPAAIQALPERIDHAWLRSQAVRPREARIESLQTERQDQLSDLFIAVQGKARSTEFEAGLRGRKRRKLDVEGSLKTEDLEGSEEFLRRYSDAQSLRELDLSLPPLSPSPPPASPARTKHQAQGAADTVPNSEDDVDMDAEGEEEDEELAVAEALAPHSTTVPRVSVTSTSSVTAPIPAPTATVPSETQPPPAIVPSDSQPVASTSTASDAATKTVASPSKPPNEGQSATAAPSSLTADKSAAAPPSPQPPVTASPAYIPPPPYTSLFGIEEISTDYTDTLPTVPNEILRNRLNTTLALRANTKKSSKTASTTSSSTSLVQPDLYKLHVRAQHMGAQNFLGPGKRVHNALSTHEWDVGVEEMKSVRVFERIEQLKAEKKWSFRQPKKQRIGIVPKAHWDYVLDEMRWMQTDFRQETRWKIVTAHRLARACRAWHRTSPEDRPALCVRTRPPRSLDDSAESMEEEMEDDSSAKTKKGKEKEVSESIEEDAEGEEDAGGEPEEETIAIVGTTPVVASTGTSARIGSTGAGAGKAGGSGGDEKTLDPNKGSVSRSQQAQAEAAKQQSQAQHIQALINFRNPIFDLGADETVVDYEVLTALRDANAAGQLSDEALAIAELDFVALFPDLPLYSDFIVADDANTARRVEDSSAWMGRLAHVSRLLETKPLLVSTLQPGRTKTRDGWLDETASLLEDIEPPTDPREQLPNVSSVLFAGRKPKDAAVGEVLVKPTPVAQPDVRASSILWLPDEDAKLLSLQKQYGFNWPLIAEVFNMSTARPSSDHRLPWDCYDRWDRLIGPGSKKVLPDGTEISVPAPEYIPPVDNLGRSVPVIGNGSKKSARHVSIIEAMKKVQKLREASSLKAPPPGFPRRINMSMHESHNLPPRPFWTPMEWSTYKAEQEIQKARLRQAQAQAEAQAQAQQRQQQVQDQQAAAAAAAQQNGGQARYPGPGPVAGSFANGQPQRGGVPSSLPAQMAAAQAQAHAQAQARGSPNGGSPSSLPLPNLSSPSPGTAAQLLNGQQQLQLQQQLAQSNGGQPPQLTPEQLQLLQQRQQAMIAAQAQRMQQQQQQQQQQHQQQQQAAQQLQQQSQE